MTDRLAALLVIAALAAASPASAEIHRWVDGRGIVNYSDRPPQPPNEPFAAAGLVAPAQPVSPDEAPAQPVAVAVPAPAQPVSTPVAPPSVAAASGPVTLDELFELTGTRRQVSALTLQLGRELRPAKGQVPAPAEATIERIVARTFQSDAVLKMMREEFARGLDRSQLAAKLAWLRSPLGHRIAALEMDSADPDRDRHLAAFAAKLKAAPPSERRRELIERLDWVSGASDVSTDVATALSSSIARAIALSRPADRRASRRQLDSQAEEMRTTVAGAVRKAALVSMLYTYRSLSDEELERYVEFESTEAGRWYNALLRHALLTALTRSFDATTQAVFAAVPPERWSRAAAAGTPPR